MSLTELPATVWIKKLQISHMHGITDKNGHILNMLYFPNRMLCAKKEMLFKINLCYHVDVSTNIHFQALFYHKT
jgi:hypothetical protein